MFDPDLHFSVNLIKFRVASYIQANRNNARVIFQYKSASLFGANQHAHKTPAVREWLEAHPHIHLHFTPTSSWWFNAVEVWFAQMERRALYRGVFTSVPELKSELRRFIEVHNEQSAKPFKWTKPESNIIATVIRAKHALHN